MKLTEFESAYYNKYKYSIDPKKYGFESIKDLLSRMKETIVVRQNSNNTFVIIPRNALNVPSNNNASKSKEDATTNKNKNHGVPDEIKREMKETIFRYEQGILAHVFYAIIRVSDKFYVIVKFLRHTFFFHFIKPFD